MKLLCLHGYGTNAECLRSQLLPTMNALGGEHELVFLEGELPVGKSVFTGNFDPPYLAYYEDAAYTGTAAGHKLIEEMIETDGPFDGILGFSQGASLCISYLLHRRINIPDEPPKFKFGVFFSTSFIVSPDPTYKQDEVMSFLRHLTDDDIKEWHGVVLNTTSRKQDLEKCSFIGKLSSSERTLMLELGWEACSLYQTRTVLHIEDKVEYVEKLRTHDLGIEMFPRFYNPIYTSEKLDIPTVHCMGRNDSEALRNLSIIGRDLCENGTKLEHAGRHELPMKQDDAVAVANAIEKCFYLGQQIAVAV